MTNSQRQPTTPNFNDFFALFSLCPRCLCGDNRIFNPGSERSQNSSVVESTACFNPPVRAGIMTPRWVQESISVLGSLLVPVFVPLFAIHD